LKAKFTDVLTSAVTVFGLSVIPAWVRQSLGVVGRSLSAVGLERALSSCRSGFILGFHDVPAKSFISQIEAFPSLQIISLTELIQRIRSNKSTKGFVAITVDDGVQGTVRALSAAAIEKQWPITFFLPTQYLDDSQSATHMIWTNISAYLPLGTLKLPGATYELNTKRKRAQFIALMKRRLHTRPLKEYETFFKELRDYLVACGSATYDQLNPPPAISWDEVARWSKNSLIDFQSHGVSHEAAAAMSTAKFEAELKFSQQRISDVTGRACRHFCYPFGGFASIGTKAPAIAAKYYDSAVTMARGRVAGHQLMTLPRFAIQAQDSPGLARFKVLAS
jgi:peptidoglycan/xylan/chitin deacetylase (PgdA/CDA1 family)